MELWAVYITRREFDTLKEVTTALQQAGIDCYIIYSGRDRQLAVPEQDKERAYEVVQSELHKGIASNIPNY